jgi:GDPmannose 4,6-dehydratase
VAAEIKPADRESNLNTSNQHILVMSLKHIAFITGITGQDGSYLAEFLLEKGYIIYGMKRRHSTLVSSRIDHLRGKIHLIYGDMNDAVSIMNILSTIKAKHFSGGDDAAERLEIYNLAAQSHVQVSFQVPEYTADSDGMGTLRILEAIRILKLEKVARFYQASTSEMFGLVQEIPQKETTPFYPRSPYACAKLYAHWIVKNYREAYNLYACSGILFNHESPRRGENFVTRKITLGIAKIMKGKLDVLTMGNINALRDWGHARDFIEGMWLMLQQDQPDDFVLSTGEQHTVREFIEKSFSRIGITIEWQGEGVNEKGIDAETGKVLVNISPDYYRPTEVETLLGDCTKAKTKLGWKHRVAFDELVNEMVDADMSS